MAKKDHLTEELNRHFGFGTFKGNQKAIIENVLAGKDTFVLMPTGGGKSLCYQLPSILMEGTAIVISPLIALMKNQVDAMRNFSEEDGVAHFINSSLNKSAIDQVKSDILSGRTKLLYVAPESLTKEENVDFLRQVKISFYAVDETLIPTGIEPVEGTPMDLRKSVVVGADIDNPFTQLVYGGGYDHNWILNAAGDINKVAAKVVSPTSGIVMEVYTNEPGLQFYAGNSMTKAGDKGKLGVVYPHRGALCLETQHYPDSPNQPAFPSVVLRPGEKYTSECIYKFSVE